MADDYYCFGCGRRVESEDPSAHDENCFAVMAERIAEIESLRAQLTAATQRAAGEYERGVADALAACRDVYERACARRWGGEFTSGKEAGALSCVELVEALLPAGEVTDG